jgi:hypothetical protein
MSESDSHEMEMRVTVKDELVANLTFSNSRVQSVLRYIDHRELFTTESPNNTFAPHVDDSQKIIMSDPIATLIHVENYFWLCIEEVNGQYCQ